MVEVKAETVVAGRAVVVPKAVAVKVVARLAVVVVKAMVAAGLAAPEIHQAVAAVMHRQAVARSNNYP